MPDGHIAELCVYPQTSLKNVGPDAAYQPVVTQTCSDFKTSPSRHITFIQRVLTSMQRHVCNDVNATLGSDKVLLCSILG